MLATLIPMFDEKMMVCAYSIFAQKENYFLNPELIGSARFDGAGHIIGLEIVDVMGVHILSDDRPIFVPVDQISIYSSIKEQCSAPHEKIVLLIDPSIEPSETSIARIKELKSEGYRFAIRKITLDMFVAYKDILLQMEFCLLDYTKLDMAKAKILFDKAFPNLKLCAVNIDSREDFDSLREGGGYSYYEGSFFRLPVNEAQTEVAPLKINYIELLNIINKPNFELTDAADVIGRDVALVVSLLKMVNRMAVNSEITSVRHAAAMLGQKDLKKWINTAVTKELCADKPSEITRVSMQRAKFAENLAPVFEMGGLSSELFLLGLFSVIDIMLDEPMEEALKMVQVSKNIEKALLEDEGELADVLDFIREYEAASWQEVSRIMLLKNIDMDKVYDAYVDALKWQRDLLAAS